MTFTAGQNLTADALNTSISNVTPLWARKTANQTVNNSTTLVDDSELVVTVAANSTYKAWLHGRYDSSAVADMKINFTVPAGTNTPHWTFIGGGTNANTQHAAAASTSFATIDGQGVGTAAAFDLLGTFTVSSTAGTIRLQFAQNTAEATNTTLQVGSTLLLIKVA